MIDTDYIDDTVEEYILPLNSVNFVLVHFALSHLISKLFIL
jgi:hypothetical protein